MARYGLTIKKIISLLLITFAFSYQQANAEYAPALSMGLSKETYVVNADASVIQSIESSIKIESQKGVDNFAKRSISYNSKYEQVEIIEAYTLQPDGKKIKVSKDAIRTAGDSLSSGTTMFSETKHKVIVYPDVKVGSELYFKSKSIQRVPTFKGHFFFSEYFSPHFKYKDQIYKFEISDKLPVQFDIKGVKGGLVKTANHKKYYEFSFNQDKAVPSEDAEVDSDDFSPYITATSIKDYIELGKVYEKGAANKIKVTQEIKDLADELTLGTTDKKAQVEILYNWVSSNIRYVAIYLADGGVVPHSAETILKNRYGDCKDHTIILASLLQAKGIESSTALINLGYNYVLPKLPVLAPFNHVINYIPSLDIYLDSTAQFSPYGTLPFDDMDKPVVLTALEKLGHTPIPKANENVIRNDVFIRIKNDGSMVGESKGSVTGYFNNSYRNYASEDEGRDDLERVKERLKPQGEIGVGKITETNPSDLTTPFVENTHFTLDPKSNFPGPGAITIPVGVVILSMNAMVREKPNETLKYPAISYSKTMIDNYTLKFPRNVKIKRVPSNVNFNNALYHYQASYQLKGDEVKVSRIFESDHKSISSGPKFAESRNVVFKVLQRDLRSQIFYE
jgi:hypothetical protein